MSAIIRSTRNLSPYLLPATLLAIAGILLMGLLYYPSEAINAARASQTIVTANERCWNAHTEHQFATMLTEAMRRLQADRQSQMYVPYYPHQRKTPSGDIHTGLRKAPLVIENSGDFNHPILIRL